MEKQLKTITVEEQRQMGIRRTQYTPATPECTTALARTHKMEAPAQPPMVLEVTPTATSHIDMRTSAVDRAKGFLIASMPRTFAFSLAVTVAGIVLAGWSLAVALVILFATFSVVELGSYIFTLLVSAEGTAHYEARQKWAVIKREQAERWAHYQKLMGGQ